VSWSTVASAPPCLRFDSRRIDPEAPHRVYLFKFPRIGGHGVFKVGITHCVDDRRLTQHIAAGGELVQVVDVPDRATAFAIETTVLERVQPMGPVAVSISDLPQAHRNRWLELRCEPGAFADEPLSDGERKPSACRARTSDLPLATRR
jgi:hypothetical protein